MRLLRGRLAGWPRSELWRNGDFVRLWAGQAVSEPGGQVTLVALPLAAILVLDASAFEVAVLSSLEFAMPPAPLTVRRPVSVRRVSVPRVTSTVEL